MKEPDYIEKSAIFDESECYRYLLTRRWSAGPIVLWIMINPSTANAVKLDPTLKRCLGFTMRWSTRSTWIRPEQAIASESESFGALEVCNLYGYRSPHPEDLWTKTLDPVGPDNDEHIIKAANRAAIVICGWGNDARPDRERHVAQLLADHGVQPYCLALCKNGSPSHPLARGKARIPDTATPMRWHAKGLHP